VIYALLDQLDVVAANGAIGFAEVNLGPVLQEKSISSASPFIGLACDKIFFIFVPQSHRFPGHDFTVQALELDQGHKDQGVKDRGFDVDVAVQQAALFITDPTKDFRGEKAARVEVVCCSVKWIESADLFDTTQLLWRGAEQVYVERSSEFLHGLIGIYIPSAVHCIKQWHYHVRNFLA
jgi:hypothetical protein